MDDLLGLFDQLSDWLLSRLPGDVRAYLVVPIVVAALLVTPRVVVHRVLPWIGRYLLVPAVSVITAVLVSAGLLVDVVLARLFRLVRLPLTAANHAIGDWAITGTRGVRGAARYRINQFGWWLAHFNSALLLLAGAALVILWSRGYCTRHPASTCTEPISAWWQQTRTVLPDIKVPWA